MTRPPLAQTLPDLVEELAGRQDGRMGIVFQDDVFSWSQVALRVRKVAAGLRELGVGSGDRVAVLMGNRPEWIISNLAVTHLGAIFVGLNTWYQEDDLQYTLAHSGAGTIVCSGEHLGRDFIAMVENVWPRCPDLTRVVVLDESQREPGAWTRFAELEGSAPIEGAPLADPEAAANILYTSGTTGKPKGVVLHHDKLIANGFQIGERQHQNADDVLLAAIPFFFSFFSANAFPAIMTHGGGIVVQERFAAAEALDLMERHRCSVYYGMPNMTHALLEEQRRRPRQVESLRKGATIGPPEMIRLTATLVPGISNIYGLTETYGNCAVCDADEPLELRATTQGFVLPGFEWKVVDSSTGERLAPGESGLMCFKGNVTSGYYRADEVNAASFDSDGFFITGDRGTIDQDGRLHYEGRIKELIKTGGINVSPIQVEDVLMSHDAVRQAHVVGRPDPTRGEVGVAFIEIEPGAEVDSGALLAHCRSRLPSYAVPVEFRFVTDAELPRTATGKVRKVELVDWASESTVAP